MSTVLLYADKITTAINAALPTPAAAWKQLAYNEQYGIIPKSVSKQIIPLIDGIYATAIQLPDKSEKFLPQINVSDAAVSRKLQQLEKAMHQAAKNLEFEQAAAYNRDELLALKNQIFYKASFVQ